MQLIKLKPDTTPRRALEKDIISWADGRFLVCFPPIFLWHFLFTIFDPHRLYEEKPDDSVEKCALLLDEPSLDTAVRVGDVYGMMIEHYAHTGNYQKVQ